MTDTMSIHRARRRRARRPQLVALVLVVVLLAAYGGYRWRENERAEAARVAAWQCLESSEPAIMALLSYDHRDFDGAVARGLSHTTGPYTAEYVAAMAALRPSVLAEQVVMTAQRSATVIHTPGLDRVVLRFYMYQYRSTAGGGSTQLHQLFLATFDRVGSGWRVSALSPLTGTLRSTPSPSALP